MTPLARQLDVADGLRTYKGEQAICVVLSRNYWRDVERFWTVHIWLNYLVDAMITPRPGETA